MPEQTTWLIGAAEHCDFVFDVPTVSGEHCIISLDDSRYSLTDLNSTNGTFVNGNQISSVQSVTPEDEICLGTITLFSWSLLGEKSSQRIIRIGRAADNDIVFDDPSVSLNHAQIISKASRNVIQDLCSTRGRYQFTG